MTQIGSPKTPLPAGRGKARALRLVRQSSLIVAGVLGLATLLAEAQPQPERGPVVVEEEFDPSLSSISSVDQAVAYVVSRHPHTSHVQFADAADAFLRKRFFHDTNFSSFRPQENWAAYLAGFAWDDLKKPVIGDEILNYRRAACSQQAIVFQEMVRTAGIPFLSVRAPGHFMTAVRLDGRWFVYDANKEIQPTRYPLAILLQGNEALEKIYPAAMGKSLRDSANRGLIELTDMNENPAWNATLFHRATHIISNWGWAFFLAVFLMTSTPFRRRGANTRLKQVPLQT